MVIKKKLPFVIGLATAPLVALVAFPVGNCIIVAGNKWHHCTAQINGFVWYGLPPAGLATLLLGVPLILAAIRFGKTTVWHFLIGGAAVGLLSSLILGLADTRLSIAGLAAISAPIGALASFIFWFLGVRGNLKDPSLSPSSKH